MKIAVVFPSFTGPYGGERLVLGLTWSLVERGHQVDLFTPRFHPTCRNMLHPEVRLKETCGRRVTQWDLERFLELFRIARLSRFLTNGYDLINVHGYPTALAAALARRFYKLRRPIVYQCNEPPRAFYDLEETTLVRLGWLARQGFLLTRRCIRMLDRWSVKETDAVITLSRFVQSQIRELYGRASHVILPGIEVERFGGPVDGSACRSRFDRGKDFIIFSCNKLHPRKRIDVLLEAFSLVIKEHSDAQIVIAGEGIERANLEQLARDLGIAEGVHFVGLLTEDELPCYYAMCDVFVYSGVREPIGGAWAEAMACGRPVIVPNDGGAAECVVEGETGFLYPTTDPKELAQKLLSCIHRGPHLRLVGAKGREWVRQYRDWKRCALEMEGVFQTLVARGWE